MKPRQWFVAAACASLLLVEVGLAAQAAAGVRTGTHTCTSKTYRPRAGDQRATLPSDSTLFFTKPVVPPRSFTAFDAGVKGPRGYLAVIAIGSTALPPTGSLTVTGWQTQSGLNGKLIASHTTGNRVSSCIGVAGKTGVTVTVP